MMQDLSAPTFYSSAPPSLATPREQVVALSVDALQKLADVGEPDAACRIAGKACITLRQADPKAERRSKAFRHRLARKLVPTERREGDA